MSSSRLLARRHRAPSHGSETRPPWCQTGVGSLLWSVGAVQHFECQVFQIRGCRPKRMHRDQGRSHARSQLFSPHLHLHDRGRSCGVACLELHPTSRLRRLIGAVGIHRSTKVGRVRWTIGSYKGTHAIVIRICHCKSSTTLLPRRCRNMHEPPGRQL